MINFCNLGPSKVTHPLNSIAELEQGSSSPEYKATFVNPIKDYDHLMNTFVDNDTNYIYPLHFSKADSFYMCCLFIIGESIAASKLVDAKVTLKSFRHDLQHHLTSEKNLYKKLNFSKRSTLTSDQLKGYLGVKESNINDNVYTYLSRLLKNDFVVIHNKQITHISKKAHTQTYIFKVITTEDNTEVFSIDPQPKINSSFDVATFVKTHKNKN